MTCLNRSLGCGLGKWSTRAVLVAAVVTTIALAGRAQNTRQAAASRDRWEYNASVIGKFELQAKLNDLGAEGWEVISFYQATSSLANQGGQLTFEPASFHVISKRRAKS